MAWWYGRPHGVAWLGGMAGPQQVAWLGGIVGPQQVAWLGGMYVRPSASGMPW